MVGKIMCVKFQNNIDQSRSRTNAFLGKFVECAVADEIHSRIGSVDEIGNASLVVPQIVLAMTRFALPAP